MRWEKLVKKRLCVEKRKYTLRVARSMPREPYDVIGKIVDLAYTDCPEESGNKILYDWNEHHKIGGGASESKSGHQFKFTPKAMRRSAKRSIKRKTSRKRSIKRKTSRKRSIKRKTSRKRSIKRKTSRKHSIKRKTSRKRSIKRKTSRKRSIKRRI
jgi:hypothetical protein